MADGGMAVPVVLIFDIRGRGKMDDGRWLMLRMGDEVTLNVEPDARGKPRQRRASVQRETFREWASTTASGALALQYGSAGSGDCRRGNNIAASRRTRLAHNRGGTRSSASLPGRQGDPSTGLRAGVGACPYGKRGAREKSKITKRSQVSGGCEFGRMLISNGLRRSSVGFLYTRRMKTKPSFWADQGGVWGSRRAPCGHAAYNRNKAATTERGHPC
jgi:hypothetical protein